MEYAELLEIAQKAALSAGAEILKIYNTADFGVEMKADNSPLTLADQKAHNIIVGFLSETNLPILSEEGRTIPFEERSGWEMFWMVDPLDGTKEFIKRNGEFTVNIALIENNQPVLGVVYAPVLNKLYFGGAAVGFSNLLNGEGEVKLNASKNLPLTVITAKKGCRIVASRSHRNQETEAFIDSCAAPDLVSMGSSLKFMVIAEGNADVYPRFAPTMEWDTAAADGVLRGLGYNVFQVVNKLPTSNWVKYNKEDLLNPYFIAF